MRTTPFTRPHVAPARPQPVLDEIIPVIAGYFFTHLALQDRRFQSRGSSLRYLYVVYLVAFEMGCMAHSMGSSPNLHLPSEITAKILIGCGAAGMFACVSAGKSSHGVNALYETSLWHFLYIATIAALCFPLPAHVFLPYTHLVLCCEPLYALFHAWFNLLRRFQ